VRVLDRLGELAHYLHPRFHRNGVAALGHEVVETLPVLAVPEDDRGAGLVFVAELLGLREAAPARLSGLNVRAAGALPARFTERGRSAAARAISGSPGPSTYATSSANDVL
jgi:hypothetical protein